jgi:branched-subunit amino acid ABC-type transport system permease component
MTFFLQLIVTGVAQGMVYALIAIGFVIILKCSEVFNIAQGHFVLIGGYLGWTFWCCLVYRYGRLCWRQSQRPSLWVC